MASKAHIMTLGISKNKISRIVGTSLASKKNKKVTLFSVIETKLVEILFDKKIDNLKQVNRNHITPQLYGCSDAANKINYYGLLSLTTGAMAVAEAEKIIGFEQDN